MNWREFRKLAEADGWTLARHGKEHDIYVHHEKGVMQMERHWSREIKPGLLNRLLKLIRQK